MLCAVLRCAMPGGALLVAEMLLDEGGTSPPEVLLQSLNMLTQTHGRERKLSEYSHLLESVGFTNIQGKKTGEHICPALCTMQIASAHICDCVSDASRLAMSALLLLRWLHDSECARRSISQDIANVLQTSCCVGAVLLHALCCLQAPIWMP